jgi:hypothetical protein
MKYLGVVGLVLLSGTCWAVPPEEYRYDIEQTTALYSYVPNAEGISNTDERKVVLKLDKKTGKAWMLKHGITKVDGRVTGYAFWTPVADPD